MQRSPRAIPLLRALVVSALLWAAGSVDAAAQTAPAPAQPAPLAARGGLLTATDPDLVTTLRAGVAVSPAYLGSDDYELGPDLDIRFDYVRFPGGLEFGSSRSVGYRTGWGLSGSLRYLGSRDSEDHDALQGLDNVDWSLEAGLGVGYEQRNYRAFTDVRYGFIGHNAWVGEIGADAIAYPTEGLTLTLGPRLEFGDNRFAETYFGISPSEAAASDLPEFNASGGLLAAGVEFNARYLFNERWGVEGAAAWDRLLNDAADSPITGTGSEDQYEIRLGITRSISLDF